jgi:DNA-binding transcriptional MerR regulator
VTRLAEFVTVEQTAEFPGISANTLRTWHRDARLSVSRDPIHGCRLFKKADLEGLPHQIEESGIHPSGWRRPGKPK